MANSVFKKTVLYTALAGLLYQVVCGMAIVFQLPELYLWFRFYPFPVSAFWYAIYSAGSLIAMAGILLFFRNKKNSVFIYFLGKMLMLIFLLHAFMVKFTTSYTEPFIETYLAGIGAWMIYPILILVLLKTQNHKEYDRTNS